MTVELSVTFVLPGLSSHPSGGYKVVYQHASWLAGRGHHVTVVHSRNAHGAIRVGGARAFISGCIGDIGPGTPSWFELPREVEVVNRPLITARMLKSARVLVATSATTAPVVERAASRYGAAGVYLIQGHEHWYGPDFVDRTYQLNLQKVTVAPWLTDLLARRGLAAQTVCNGVSREEFPPGPPLERRRWDVSAVMSDLPWKRTDLAVEVMNKLVASTPGLRVLTFGLGRRPRGLAPTVSYVQNPQPPVLTDLFQQSKVFVSTSDREGWGLPIAEAMSCGAAVVSTDNLGVRAFAHGAVRLAAPGDADGLLRNICQLLADPSAAAALGEMGQKRIREFSLERAQRAFERVLSETRAQVRSG